MIDTAIEGGGEPIVQYLGEIPTVNNREPTTNASTG